MVRKPGKKKAKKKSSEKASSQRRKKIIQKMKEFKLPNFAVKLARYYTLPRKRKALVRKLRGPTEIEKEHALMSEQLKECDALREELIEKGVKNGFGRELMGELLELSRAYAETKICEKIFFEIKERKSFTEQRETFERYEPTIEEIESQTPSYELLEAHLNDFLRRAFAEIIVQRSAVHFRKEVNLEKIRTITYAIIQAGQTGKPEAGKRNISRLERHLTGAELFTIFKEILTMKNSL